MTYWSDGPTSPSDPTNKNSGLVITNPCPVNILWKTQLRGWANNQPIVVDKRVITTAEPNWLICLDADTGKVMWEKPNSPFELMGLPEEDVRALDEYLAAMYTVRMIYATLLGNYCRLKVDWVTREPDMWKRQLDRTVDILETLVATNKFGANATNALGKIKAAMPLFADPNANGGEIQRQLSGFVWHLGTEWIQKQCKIFAVVHWDAWMGWTFPTPISDGERIYAWMGQGQVVCYDLDGNKLWATFMPFDPKKAGRGDGLLHCCSPVLAGDVLVVEGVTELCGFDRRTGRRLWSTTGTKGGSFGVLGGHMAIRLPTGRQLIAAKRGVLLNPADGSRVGDLGLEQVACASIVYENGIIPLYRGPGGGAGGSSKLVGFALEDGGGTNVVCKDIWETPQSSGDNSPVLYQSVLYHHESAVDIRIRTCGVPRPS